MAIGSFLCKEDQRIELVIADNGNCIEFDPESISYTTMSCAGLKLLNTRKQRELSGGSFSSRIH